MTHCVVEGGGGGGFLSITVLTTTSFLAPVVFVDSLAKLIKLFKVVLDFGDSTFLLDLLVCSQCPRIRNDTCILCIRHNRIQSSKDKTADAFEDVFF